MSETTTIFNKEGKPIENHDGIVYPQHLNKEQKEALESQMPVLFVQCDGCEILNKIHMEKDDNK